MRALLRFGTGDEGTTAPRWCDVAPARMSLATSSFGGSARRHVLGDAAFDRALNRRARSSARDALTMSAPELFQRRPPGARRASRRRLGHISCDGRGRAFFVWTLTALRFATSAPGWPMPPARVLQIARDLDRASKLRTPAYYPRDLKPENVSCARTKAWSWPRGRFVWQGPNPRRERSAMLSTPGMVAARRCTWRRNSFPAASLRRTGISGHAGWLEMLTARCRPPRQPHAQPEGPRPTACVPCSRARCRSIRSIFRRL